LVVEGFTTPVVPALNAAAPPAAAVVEPDGAVLPPPVPVLLLLEQAARVSAASVAADAATARVLRLFMNDAFSFLEVRCAG
jgi:hypothetical protein